MRIVLFIATVFITLNFNKQVDCEIILWNKNKPLTWNNFKGIVDEKNIHDAISTCDILFNYKRIGDTLRLVTRCELHMYKSWIKKGKQTPYLLKHEQGHFDIVAIFTRKLRQSYSNFNFKKNTFKNEVNIQYQKINIEKLKYQKLYDFETDHSRIKTKQLEWEKKIAKELKELEAYSNTELKILLK